MQNCIFIGRIPIDISEQKLFEIFSQFGTVVDVKIIRNSMAVSKGYGFITYASQETADRIITENSNMISINSSIITIGPAMKKLSLQIEKDKLFDILQINTNKKSTEHFQNF